MIRSAPARAARAAALVLLVLALQNAPGPSMAQPAPAPHLDEFAIVDCLLPGKVRHLGAQQVYVTRRRPVRTTVSDCAIRGGEYTLYDRADLGAALAVWRDAAAAGDADAMLRLGEMLDGGLGVPADPAAAAGWYRRAADKGRIAAMVQLGHLFETGRGVPRDAAEAAHWYRRAAGLPDAPAPLALEPPAIEIIDPPLVAATRGVRVVAAGGAAGVAAGETTAPPSVELAPGTTERAVVGRISAPAGLLSFVVNDRTVEVDAHGLFRAAVPLAAGRTPVRAVAVDRQGRRASVAFEFAATLAAPLPATTTASRGARLPAGLEPGRYVALLAANQAYADLPRLTTPAADARALAELLETRYGFTTRVVVDATRYQLLSALNDLRRTLSETDNLLVYFAGHGEFEREIGRGYWLPVDAEKTSTANWISTATITDVIGVLPARHVLVIADSCYAGALTRSSLARLDPEAGDAARAVWLRAVMTKRSRTALTSGGLQPVLDAGGGGHSVFAKALLAALAQNDDVLDARRLHLAVAARVAYSASNAGAEQEPEYAPIRFAGHEAGEFVFVPRP